MHVLIEQRVATIRRQKLVVHAMRRGLAADVVTVRHRGGDGNA